MTTERSLDHLRRDARRLLRAVAAGDPTARKRAATVRGVRPEQRFVLADALHVVAREQGAESWPALVARSQRGAIRSALDEALAEDGRAEVDVQTGLTYPDGVPLYVTIRRREHRYVLDDGGGAISRAGRPPGWADVAHDAVRPSGMNVSPTTGIVFVPVVEGRDLEELAVRLGEASLDVLEALLELDVEVSRRSVRHRAG